MPTHSLLEEARRLRLKKSYSQNFLVDESVLSRIVNFLGLQPEEIVLEIGPGAGFLTRKLLEHSIHLTAVELDPHMVKYLTKKFSDTPCFDLVHQDILQFDFDRLGSGPYTVVGNLPYNITSPILFKLTGELNVADYPLRRRIRQACLMVQREVGERICARPGSKAYNPLSIAVQFWFEASLAFTIPPQAYYPAPKVHSAIVRLTPRTEPAYPVADLDRFNQLIRAAFGQRRKTLRNALLAAPWLSPGQLDAALTAVGLSPDLRAEQVSIEQFGALANALPQHAG
jgi:16S rRNA (adenine1518-N6/adenine1519-N6)-dimethyltransferase